MLSNVIQCYLMLFYPIYPTTTPFTTSVPPPHVLSSCLLQVAAVCVYPEFVCAAKEQIAALGGQMRVATVVNFPSGDGEVEQIKVETGDLQRKPFMNSRVVSSYIPSIWML